MNKLEMAHQMAIAIQSSEPMTDMVLLSSLCFSYADAMFAEFEKRKDKTLPDVLWQPDWSLAHDDAVACAMDSNGDMWWHSKTPKIDGQLWNGCAVDEYENHNYTGDWRDSLRIRPEGV